MTFTLIERQAAAQKAIDQFLYTPFAWGQADCACLARLMLKAAGHRDPLAKLRPYRTLKGAFRALKNLGATSLTEAVDQCGLERIPPASSLIGDIVVMPSDHGDHFPALGVNVGMGRVLAFMDAGQGERGDFIDLKAAISAWRVA